MPRRQLPFGHAVKYVCDRGRWAPLPLVKVLWRSLSTIRGHRDVFELLKVPEYAELVRDDPRFGLRYLAGHYLASWITVPDRASCFVNHYRFLYDKLPRAFLRKMLHETWPLVKIDRSGHQFSVTIGSSHTEGAEGELSLRLEVDGEPVFMLSFTIVPGRILNCASLNALLVSRLQGVKGRFRQISLATKSMAYVSPPDLLLAVLQGIGEGFGIDVVACIFGADHISYCEEYSSLFAAAYDQYFADRVLARRTDHVFLSPIPITEKPLSHLTEGHKLRARKRRQFKRQVAADVRQLICGMCSGDVSFLHSVC